MSQPAERDSLVHSLSDLPEEVIRDPKLREIYFLTVDRLWRQVEDAGLGYDAYMLGERCAFYYVLNKQKDARPMSFSGNQQVSLPKMWLEFQKEFAIMVRSAPKKQAEMWQKMQDIIFAVVAAQAPNVQRKLATDFSTAFEREKVR